MPPRGEMERISVERRSHRQVLVDHLKGRITCGWYCLNKDNKTKWACVDADSEDGLMLLRGAVFAADKLGILGG
jgi:hypothetical protein